MLDFGIEIECLVPSTVSHEVVAAAITAAGVPCYFAGYTHRVDRASWKIVTDGSVVGTGTPLEVVSPPFITEDGFEQVKKVSEVLTALDATVNRSCGLHVHIGACNLSVPALKKLAALYIEHEGLIDQLLPNSRRGSDNNYCKSVATRANIVRLSSAANIRDIAEAVSGGDRFVKLNYQAFWRHGTVEFRHHSGTVDAAKIIKWVVFCQKLVETAIREANEPIYDFWRRGRRLRQLGQLVSRPEGVTNEEYRVALGITSRPGIRNELARRGAPFHIRGRRGGFEIYHLGPVPGATAASTTTVTSLEGLYDKLGLGEEDKSFWAARAAQLIAANQGGGATAVHNP